MRRHSILWSVAGVLLVVAVTSLAWANAEAASATPTSDAVEMSAAEAYERGMGAFGVQLSSDGRGVVLADTTLIEDDGPGAGSILPYVREEDRSPTIVLDARTRVKKVLCVGQPAALEARLYVPTGASIELNGVAVDTPANTKFPAIPVELLHEGDNVVVLSRRGGKDLTIKVAARDHILHNAPERATRPARSFTSTDNGGTWVPIDGEVTVRLNLRQYAAEGHFISPVIDFGLTVGQSIAPPNVSIRSVAIRADAQVPPGCRVEFAVRTGTSPVFDASRWTGWSAPGDVMEKGHRFVQWKATLSTDDPTVTPVLTTVAVSASVDSDGKPGWGEKVVLREVHNGNMLYTSMPFAYEAPDHPKLVALREKYNLDDVIKDGQTELEKLVMLRDWVSHQWRFKGPEGKYPAWDAHEILERKIGMCVQYAIVYVQCAASLGYQARFVFGYHPGTMRTAHEVCEVWSNEYGKWVFMDPNGNRHHVDPKTGVPLSMLEVHDRMVRTYYGDNVATYDERPREPAYCDEIATCSRLAMTPPDPSERLAGNPKRWLPWTKWLYVRCVPRNDWYARPVPLPRMQGWNSYDWTGYWTWSDAQTPRDWRYGHVTGRRADWEWTLNQVRFAATYGSREGALTVHMGTVTPHFDTFLVRTDGGNWKPSGRTLEWRLRPGTNRLEMRVRNSSGVLGHVSILELDYSK